MTRRFSAGWRGAAGLVLAVLMMLPHAGALLAFALDDGTCGRTCCLRKSARCCCRTGVKGHGAAVSARACPIGAAVAAAVNGGVVAAGAVSDDAGLGLIADAVEVAAQAGVDAAAGYALFGRPPPGLIV